ncbi:WhiB family transcriptional regulator [Nocardia carnea]|uniref:WhiB family transcriptional regulator n=1 Tax=Nocardia carnea TaxID=37328 RepID=UPI002457EDB8|nr:WhiB family transcriptional regulator [Nocardia carnea]
MSTVAKRQGPACADVADELFFPASDQPPAVQKRVVTRAQAICAGCPIRRQCAEFSAPLVESRLLADCVVAGVRVPADYSTTTYKAMRKAVAAQLRDIAAGRDITDLLEGAA